MFACYLFCESAIFPRAFVSSAKKRVYFSVAHAGSGLSGFYYLPPGTALVLVAVAKANFARKSSLVMRFTRCL
jgi:hypothetical protein